MELWPDPSRMIEGLRDTGYNFNTAVADILDNSIAAGASLIKVGIKLDFAGELKVTFADNGCGMDQPGLINAMKYGSSERPDPSSLGKFGLGLKTASTAFCRSLSVITRNTADTEVLKATWDLDVVAREHKWELLMPTPTDEDISLLNTTAVDSSGTLVVWDKIDRLLKKYQNQSGKHAQKALEKIIESLREHISMVYQRFLDEEYTEAPNVRIEVEGEFVLPWDPFCKKEPNIEIAAKEKMAVENTQGEPISEFEVTAYVLPRKEEFQNQNIALTAKISNDLQGIYIYRENRLIHYADWLGMFSKEPHGSLLRVEFSFDHTLDEAFRVDVKKSKITLDEELYNWLKEFLNGPRRAADSRSRKGTKKQIQQAAKDAHDSSNVNIASKESDIRKSEITIIDENKNEVSVKNKFGTVKIRLPISAPLKEGQFSVQPVSTIDDGLLWEPVWIENHLAVRINTGHPYYSKVYVPNYTSGVTIQGMDTLLWALCQAEMDSISSQAMRNQMEDLRFVVSKSLRRLVEDLPEPKVGDDNENS